MEEKVLQILAEGGEMKAGEIAVKAGTDKAEVDKIIKKLVKEGRIDSPKRCYYAVKA